MEAAIPISILAIGLARVYARRSTLLENVIITAIGGCAGAVVAGAIFTLPALYILKLDPRRYRPSSSAWPADAWRALSDSAAPLLCAPDARRASLSGGHGNHRGSGDRERGGSQAKLLLQATLISGSTIFSSPHFRSGRSSDFQWIPLVKAWV